jgi:hypothetical protein
VKIFGFRGFLCDNLKLFLGQSPKKRVTILLTKNFCQLFNSHQRDSSSPLGATGRVFAPAVSPIHVKQMDDSPNVMGFVSPEP